MKLKFINLLLASVLLVGSAQVFTSCKDNEADILNGLKEENLTLREELLGTQGQLPGLKQTLQDMRDHLNDSIQKNIESLNDLMNGEKPGSVQNQINDIKDQIAQDLSTKTELSDAITNITNIINNMQDGINDDILVKLASLQTQIDAISVPDITELTAFMNQWKDVLPGVMQDATDAKTLAEKNETAIAAVNQTITILQTAVDTNKDNIKANKDAIEAANTAISDLTARVDSVADEVTAVRELAEKYYDEAKKYTDKAIKEVKDLLDTKVTELKKLIDKNAADIADLQDEVADLTKRVKALEDTVNDILNRVNDLEKRISSINLNGTINPIIGYLNTPVGIQSNMLLAYYGRYNGRAYKFPGLYHDYNNKDVLTSKDLQMLRDCGLAQVEVEDGTLLIEPGDGNLGTIYFTVNPTNAVVEEGTVALVNSLGTKSLVKLTNVKPCEKLIDFGYSRAQASGVWQADATLANNASVKDIAVTIDADLIQAVKNVYKNRDKASIADLGKAIYQQVNGILPALAISTTWQEKAGANSTLSNFGVAAGVLPALSFTSIPASTHFRHIPWPDLDSSKYHVTLSSDGINIQLPDSIFQIAIDLDALSQIKLDLKLKMQCHLDSLAPVGVKVNGTVGHVPDGGTVDASGNLVFNKYKDVPFSAEGTADLESFRKNLNEQLQREFQRNSDSLNMAVDKAFEKAMTELSEITSGSITAAVKGSVDTMINSIQDQIDESLVDVIDNLNGQINSKIDNIFNRIENNRIYDALQSAVNRVNEVLDDPSHYLQPLLVYKTTKDVRVPSNVPGVPSVLGSSKVTFLATTYNAEVITPAYMKIIAVTNVFKQGDLSVNAQAGDAACLKALKTVNGGKYVNKVLYGQRNVMNISFQKGYVYELTYQAVDYAGNTSTKKYYVRVK